jgi:hypothetical protein
MAGGIFTNYPFELNIKCVIFSAIIIGLFFYCPPEMNITWKIFISFILFVIAYVAMAWYDYKFECMKLALKRGSGQYGITSKFKPETHTESQTDRTKMTSDEKALDHLLLNLYHVFIMTPVAIYIGLNGDKASSSAIIFLFVNFMFAFIYHIVRVLRKFNGVSLGHVIFSLGGSAFLLMSKRPISFYYAILGLGGYAGLKHGYELMIKSHVV